MTVGQISYRWYHLGTLFVVTKAPNHPEFIVYVVSDQFKRLAMTNINNDLVNLEEHDALDSYFECITACSWIGGEDVECVTRCVEVHLKDEE